MKQQAPRTSQRRVFIILLLISIGWNAAFVLADIWKHFWLAGIAGDFLFIAIFAERLWNALPPRYATIYERGLTIIFPILLLLCWEILVREHLLNPRWFPPPSQVLAALWELCTEYDKFTKTSLLGRPWLISQQWTEAGAKGVLMLIRESHLLATIYRVLTGFLFGAVPGILIGVLMGINRTIRLMLDATMSAIYVLPKIAIFPIMMLIFANPFGEAPKIAVVAIGSFFLVAINTMAGVRDIAPVYFESGKNYGANRWQMFWHIIVPGALPVIFAGLRLALGTAIITTVAIEFVRAKEGAGYLVLYYWEVMIPEKMYAALVVVMLLGLVLNAGLAAFEKWMMPWKRDERAIRRAHRVQGTAS